MQQPRKQKHNELKNEAEMEVQIHKNRGTEINAKMNAVSGQYPAGVLPTRCRSPDGPRRAGTQYIKRDIYIYIYIYTYMYIHRYCII